MKELLVFGDISNDFNRLGVEVNYTYSGEEYGVCEVTDKEFRIMCEEPDLKDNWIRGGWRYCEGSVQEDPKSKVIIKGNRIIAWHDYESEFEDEEEKQEYLEENDGVMPLREYHDLLNYFCEEMGCSQPRNVCALATHLAKANNMKLSELFTLYQGDNTLI